MLTGSYAIFLTQKTFPELYYILNHLLYYLQQNNFVRHISMFYLDLSNLRQSFHWTFETICPYGTDKRRHRIAITSRHCVTFYLP